MEIKPCPDPFGNCNGDEVLLHRVPGQWAVSCDCGQQVRADTKAEAIAAWNTRANHAQAEPVAWKNYAEDGDWWLTDEQEPPDSCERSEALYTHPPAQDVAALVEALKAYINDCSNEECEFCINARTALANWSKP